MFLRRRFSSGGAPLAEIRIGNWMTHDEARGWLHTDPCKGQSDRREALGLRARAGSSLSSRMALLLERGGNRHSLWIHDEGDDHRVDERIGIVRDHMMAPRQLKERFAGLQYL